MIEDNTLSPGEDNVDPIPQEDPLLQFTDEITEAKISEKLKKYSSSWESFSSDLYPKMKSWYKLYRDMESTVENVTTKIPEVFQIIETELPHLLNSVFSASYVVDASPKFQDPTGEKTYKIKNYINKCIKDLCDGRRKTEYVIKNALIYGWAVVKVVWNTTPDKDIDPITKEVVDVNSAHPDFDVIDPFSFAFDPSYDGFSINDLEWCRHRIFLSKDKMKQMRDNDECGDFQDEDLSTTEDKGREVRKSNSNQTPSNNKTFYDEYWFTYYYKNEEGKMVSGEFRAWFLANNKIIKFEKNLYSRKPFCITRAYANPNEFIGMGEAEVIGGLAKQLSYVSYQAGKLVKKLGQHLTFIEPSAGISPQNLKRIEEGVLFVQNKDGIKVEQTTDSGDIDVLVKYKASLDEQVEKITGINKFLQGESVGDITATQASYIQANSSNRLAGKLVHLQEDFMVPLAELFFMFNKQLLTTKIDFFDNNNNLISLTQDDFTGNYDWEAVGAISQSNKILQAQQNQEFLMALIQGMSISQQTINPYTLDIPDFVNQFIAPYKNIPNISTFMIPTKSIQAPPAPMTPQAPLGQAGMPSNAAPQPAGNPMAIGNANPNVQNVQSIESPSAIHPPIK